MDAAGPIAIAASVLVALGLMLLLSARTVGPNERLVVFRMGRTNRSLVRGPGRTWLLPLVDRAAVVDMEERRFDLPGLEATTVDGQRIAADVAIRLLVVDPFLNVVNVAWMDGAVPELVRQKYAGAAAARTLDEARTGQVLENDMRQPIDAVLAHWGARCSSLEVRGIGHAGATPPA